MLSTLINKELRSVLLSPKFTVTFTVCSLLLIMSVMIGINEYKQSVSQYNSVHELADQRLQQVSSWHSASYREHRKPSPLQIFASGLSYDIGRWSDIDAQSSIKLDNSIYSDDPIFAVFRILDFTFIVQVIFSLLAIIFTFDAVNGEKERGTLRLVFANAVPRTKYIMAKCIGSWLALIFPIMIPILISILLVVLFRIPMMMGDWIRLILLIGASLLYITLFVVLGVLISTLTKRSSVSFLLSLVMWIAFVLIIPRGGVVAAGQMVSVPGIAEVEGQRDAFAKNRWEQFYQESENRWRNNREEENTNDDDNADSSAPSDVDMWKTMALEDSLRKEVKSDIEQYETTLMEDWKNRSKAQQKLGFALARISPAAVYQLAAMSLADTDINLKSEYETALSDYRDDFNSYVEEKEKNSGPGAGAVMITMDSDNGMSIQTGREISIDVSDMPKFVYPHTKLMAIIPGFILNTSILIIMIAVSLFIAFVRFLKYDLR